MIGNIEVSPQLHCIYNPNCKIFLCLFVCLSVHPSVCLHLYVCLYVCLSVCPSIHPSVCICMSVCMSVCLSVCMSIGLRACHPAVCSSLSSLSLCMAACLWGGGGQSAAYMLYIFVLLNATRHTARTNTYKNNNKDNKKIRTMLNTSPKKTN